MGVSPTYTIHRYTDSVYKVVEFKGDRTGDFVKLPGECTHHDEKLSQSVSRARSMVLQYALCNEWDYFFTGTIDKSKFDRFNLDLFYSSLSQWIRDMRKKYGSRIQFLFIPEQHKDGAWHIHGLLSGIPRDRLSEFPDLPFPAFQRLRSGGFLNWPDYAAKFGFCSLGLIRDPVAVSFYIIKYICKDLDGRSMEWGRHLYFHSRPLRKAEKASEVYYYSQDLSSMCTNDYEFCRTGMVSNQTWVFPYVHDGAEYKVEPLYPVIDEVQSFEPVLSAFDYEQLSFGGMV